MFSSHVHNVLYGLLTFLVHLFVTSRYIKIKSLFNLLDSANLHIIGFFIFYLQILRNQSHHIHNIKIWSGAKLIKKNIEQQFCIK